MTIIYTPKLASELWERKSAMQFDSLRNMVIFVAENANLYYKYIGEHSDFKPEDVTLTFGIRHGTVRLGGNIMGYCWE